MFTDIFYQICVYIILHDHMLCMKCQPCECHLYVTYNNLRTTPEGSQASLTYGNTLFMCCKVKVARL